MPVGTAPRTYTKAQEAARAYMEAEKVIKAITDEVIKPHKAIMEAALDTLDGEYPAGAGIVTGCWNRPLAFTHAEATTTKWAKVVEALRPHLTATQAGFLAEIIGANAGTRTTRNVKVV